MKQCSMFWLHFYFPIDMIENSNNLYNVLHASLLNYVYLIFQAVKCTACQPKAEANEPTSAKFRLHFLSFSTSFRYKQNAQRKNNSVHDAFVRADADIHNATWY